MKISKQAQKVLSRIQKNHPEFTIDKDNHETFEAVVAYFLKKDGQLNPDKGLLIIGPIGTGKTFLLNAISSISENRFETVPILDIMHDTRVRGVEAIDEYGIDMQRRVCIDDLGEEDRVRLPYTDEKIDVGAELLRQRYLQYSRYGIVTYATSNLKKSEMGIRYGDKTASRMSEMFNVIALNGEDRRK